MKPLDKIKGKPVPEITTEQLRKAGAFGVAVPTRPKVGERWMKPSFPLPTVVDIVGVEDETVTVKWGRKKPVSLDLSLFFGQGFRPEGPRKSVQLPRFSDAVRQEVSLASYKGLVGSVGMLVRELLERENRPVDERISDAFDRLVTLAKEDEDLDLAKAVIALRAMWLTDSMPLARIVLEEVVVPVATEERAGHADHD